MARIRTIKPQFWDSPGTARASLRARLFFIAMWNWADDYGVGTANPKQLIGFAFPNDDDISAEDFPRLRKEVSECFGTVFFTFKERPFYVIPSWDEHQKTERRAKRDPDLAKAAEQAILARDSAEVGTTSESVGNSSGTQGSSGAGKGKGKGIEEREYISSSEVAVATIRPEVQHLCDMLDREMQRNGSKPNGHLKRNQDAARLLLDRDGYTVQQVEYLIRWTQDDEFWRANILSMSKLREKADQLRLKIQSQAGQSRVQQGLSVADELRRMEGDYESK